jgi:hypothetical protein
MDPVWHVAQSLTGSHTKVIPVNTVPDTAIDLGQLGRANQKAINVIRHLLFGCNVGAQ